MHGRTEATLEEIRDAVSRLPSTINSIVAGSLRDHAGRTWSTLSVGDRQRIALARALLRDPAVLIMGEPSSALDPVLEAAIASVIGKVLRGRSAILITHRISLVERADMVVLDQGKILEMGRPADR